jgi:urea carboxylase system permease
MATAPPGTATTDHAGDLASLGYKQELRRGLGPFSSFASGFSFVSILTTVFQLFALGFGLGGPAYFWTWPIVFLGQFAVCLIFAELAAQYPVAGAIYQWSRRVANDPIGWIAGWLMMIGYVISVAAIAIALQTVLPEIWSGFQLVGSDTSPLSADGAKNAIVLGSICIALCTVISSLGVTKMATLTRIGVTCEIVGVVVVLVLLFANAKRGPDVVLHTYGAGGGGSYVGPFFASMLMAAYVMYGFDSAAELSEETDDPRRIAPRAILSCMLVSAVGGGLMILAAMMAAPSITSEDLSLGGIPYVLEAVLPTALAKFVLAVVAISIFSAALAISASATRVVFSMARDGRLPFARALSYVSPRTQTPFVAGAVVSVLAIGVLLLNLGQTGVFASITSVSVVIVYMAYLFVTVPLLVKRLRTGVRASSPYAAPVAGPGVFSLGRLGLPINVFAVVWGVAMVVNIGWPRKEIFDPAGGHWYLQYSAPLFVAGTVVVGFLAFKLAGSQQQSTSSRVDTAPAERRAPVGAAGD